jgi:hypothetical protein
VLIFDNGNVFSTVSKHNDSVNTGQKNPFLQGQEGMNMTQK